MADISKIKLPNNAEYLFKDIKALSRGEQLVTNGTGMIGDNTNFSNWTFDGSKANSSAGSFTRTGGYANIGTNDFFPVNANEKYKFEFELISQNNTGTMYAMLLFYDVDKLSIDAIHTMYYSGTLTTLTQDLKAGDTIVHLGDASNYKTYGTGSHQRALTFWDYTNSFGYLYPPETYSRNHIWSAWANDNSIDKTNNTITLATAYTGATKPAGTYVSQGNSGATYKYSGIINGKVPTSWTHYTGYFDGTDYSGQNKYNYFPPATAYCKVGFLWNYNSASDQFWLTNVSVKEVPKEVTGTVAIANGGTGKTTANDAADALISSLPDWTANPTDTTKLIRRDNGNTATFGQVTFSTVWEYIKGKISSVLGLTNTNYGGTSAKATADASGNTITSYYAPKSTAVTNVALSTNKITKTINGTTTDVVTAATTSTYGITKLSTSTSSTATDLAATPSAVKTAYDLANTANGTANTALSGVNGTLIYDHTYTISNGVATFVPHVYQKGAEVTSNYAASCFTWKYRLDNNVTGTPSYVNLTTDSTTKGCTVTISALGYGGHVIGTFTPT